MKILCIGGGPAGLYFAISMKLRDPSHEITIVERNRKNTTFGWGVVLSDGVLEKMESNDRDSANEIRRSFAQWDHVSVIYKSQVITSGGHGFIGIGRLKLLSILQNRASELGVKIIYNSKLEAPDLNSWSDKDLVVCCNGKNSKIREHYKKYFGTSVNYRENKFIWLGTHQKFKNSFTFIFEKTSSGWIWAHCYQFDDSKSTVVIECSRQTWVNLGFDRMDSKNSIHCCEKIFSKYLGGHKLINNAQYLTEKLWLSFPVINNENWHHENMVLMGDAAHTAHFSIGSGTRLAIEDALELAKSLSADVSIKNALESYQRNRTVEVGKIQAAAYNSMLWFENLHIHTSLPPMQFAYALLTRSLRIDHEQLRVRDKHWLESVEYWFAENTQSIPRRKKYNSLASDISIPLPLFTHFSLRDMRLKNRVVVRPTAKRCLSENEDTSCSINDDYLVCYGANALGGAGLIITETTYVKAGEIRKPGIYTKEQQDAWRRIVDYIHRNTDSKIGIQLSYPKPSGSPSQTPQKKMEELRRSCNTLTEHDMNEIISSYQASVRAAHDSGFDLLEVLFTTQLWLSGFLSPKYNVRKDHYGGALHDRLRFPLTLIRSIRGVWPTDKPISLCLSLNHWLDELLISSEEMPQITQAFKDAGVDLIDVEVGDLSLCSRHFLPQKTGLAAMAVGTPVKPNHINTLILSGKADLYLTQPSVRGFYQLKATAVDVEYDFVEAI